jgi:hypothetical protein
MVKARKGIPAGVYSSAEIGREVDCASRFRAEPLAA